MFGLYYTKMYNLYLKWKLIENKELKQINKNKLFYGNSTHLYLSNSSVFPAPHEVSSLYFHRQPAPCCSSSTNFGNQYGSLLKNWELIYFKTQLYHL